MEGDNPFVSQFFANFVSCRALLEKKNKNKMKKFEFLHQHLFSPSWFPLGSATMRGDFSSSPDIQPKNIFFS